MKGEKDFLQDVWSKVRYEEYKRLEADFVDKKQREILYKKLTCALGILGAIALTCICIKLGVVEEVGIAYLLAIMLIPLGIIYERKLM